MRLSPSTDKADCRIIDFVDSNSRVAGIVSTPTLFGLEPEDEIQGAFCPPQQLFLLLHRYYSDETIESLEELAEQRLLADNTVPGFSTDKVPDPTSVTYIDYDNPFVSNIHTISHCVYSCILISIMPSLWSTKRPAHHI